MMNNAHVLVTGAGGFLGRHLIDYLQTHYPKVTIAGITRQIRTPSLPIQQFIGDLTNPIFINAVLSEYQPQFIFHLAGNAFSDDFNVLVNDNVSSCACLISTISHLQLASEVVVVGTAAEYGYVGPDQLPIQETLEPVPVSFYGLTKYWQTTLAQYHGRKNIKIKIARVFNIIGSHISEKLIFGSLLKQLHSGTSILKVGNTSSIRDFLDVFDVCYALDVIMQKGIPGEIYNVCSEQQTPIAYLINCLRKERPDIIVEQKQENFKQNDVSIVYGNNAKLCALGWQQSVPLQESIKKSLGC